MIARSTPRLDTAPRTPSIAEAKVLPYEALELMPDNVYRVTVRGRVVGFLSGLEALLRNPKYLNREAS
jgi:hypothetical protein